MKLTPLFGLMALGLMSLPALAQEFPLTLTHAMGETTIPAKPARVLSIGVHEQDFLYALGVAPVGVHEWWGEKPYATWIWAEDERAALGAEPAVLMGWEINMEWVAAQKPDLIVASYFSDMTAEEYGLLSAIAPVVTAPVGFPAWGAPWQEELRILGQATGTADRAEAVITDLEAKFAEARAKAPSLAGKTGAVAYFMDGVVRTYNTADTAHRFLTNFGMVIPPEYDALAVERGHIDFSLENLAPIDLDMVFFPEEPPEGGPLSQVTVFAATRLAKEGRAINLGGGDLSAALSFQTPLAMEWMIEVLPPLMEAAADGDPATPAIFAQ